MQLSSGRARRRPAPLRLAALGFALVLAGGFSADADGPPITGGHLVPPPPASGEPGALSHVHCEDGFAGPYPCRNIDLLAFMPRSALGAGPTENLNDIWGWTDPVTGHEYALVGRESGTSFVDVSDPEHPLYVGNLPTRTFSSAWRDIKTYHDHAFVVADRSPDHGMQVFDLNQLRGVTSPPVTFRPTAEYHGPGLGASFGGFLGSSHNLAIDEETGFAYAVGSNTCAAGLHMIDVRNPARPRFAGCFSADGYTHDAQCVVYRGPDSRFSGRELCFAANEDTLTIVDVQDKRRPAMLARAGYAGFGYTHQGWLTEDQRYFLLDDEFDELNDHHGTRTYIWDVRDVRQPLLIGTYTSPSPSTDHNLYVRGNLVYEANYRSGLRILDLAAVAEGRLTELAYFDVEPASDEAGFAGSWSSYPYFRSGVVVVSGIGTGLFVLAPFGHGEGHPAQTGGDPAGDPAPAPAPSADPGAPPPAPPAADPGGPAGHPGRRPDGGG